MKFRYHYAFECLVILPLVAYLMYYTHDLSLIIPAFLGITWGSLFPDADHRFKKELHRNGFFHGLLIPVLFYALALYYQEYLVLASFLCLGHGLHLLLDIHLNPNKRVGYYTIAFWYVPLTKKQYRLSGKASTWWLFLSFVGSVAVFIITIWTVMI